MTGKAMATKPNLQRAIVGFCSLLALAVYVMIWPRPARGRDWQDSFALADRSLWDPYQVPLHNARWVALRLLDGDERIAEAMRTGELGDLSHGDIDARAAQLQVIGNQ